MWQLLLSSLSFPSFCYLLLASNFIQFRSFPESLVACSFTSPRSFLFQVSIQSFTGSVFTQYTLESYCSVKKNSSPSFIWCLSTWNLAKLGTKVDFHLSLLCSSLHCRLIMNFSKSALSFQHLHFGSCVLAMFFCPGQNCPIPPTAICLP